MNPPGISPGGDLVEGVLATPGRDKTTPGGEHCDARIAGPGAVAEVHGDRGPKVRPGRDRLASEFILTLGEPVLTRPFVQGVNAGIGIGIGGNRRSRRRGRERRRLRDGSGGAWSLLVRGA